MKKTIALTLVLLLCLSFIPLSAFAEEATGELGLADALELDNEADSPDVADISGGTDAGVALDAAAEEEEPEAAPEGEPELDGEVITGQFAVEYDPWGDEASITVEGVNEGNALEQWTTTYGFTQDQTLHFTLTPPAERSGAEDKPIVELEVYDDLEEDPVSVLFSADNGIALTKDGGAWKFDYTPTTTQAFFVRVWWSAYDQFWAEENEYVIVIADHDNGTVTLTPAAGEGKSAGHGNAASKNVFPLGTSVTVSIKPDEDYELTMLYIGYDEYEGEELEALYNEQTGCYEYTVTGPTEEEGSDVYFEPCFSFVPTPEPEDPFCPKWDGVTAVWTAPEDVPENTEFTVELFCDYRDGDEPICVAETGETSLSFLDQITKGGHYTFRVSYSEDGSGMSDELIVRFVVDSATLRQVYVQRSFETTMNHTKDIYNTHFYVGTTPIGDPGKSEYLDKDYKPCEKSKAAYHITGVEYSDYERNEELSKAAELGGGRDSYSDGQDIMEQGQRVGRLYYGDISSYYYTNDVYERDAQVSVETYTPAADRTDKTASADKAGTADAKPAAEAAPKTGDNSRPILCLVLLLTGAAALAGTGGYSRKRRKN